ncbi:MAG: 3-phosphoshikimate 1-carboxyvinyltransferase, partial [Butyricicoccus sp.]|nr:3-phosphoshikimate 1-carboxyvinyltransferase [Butyricicoccus sp.]
MILAQSKNGLRGTITVPGDKSISHRSVMLGALANGTTHVTGFLMGEDCLSTIDCFRKMGVKIKVNDTNVVIHGVGLHGLTAPTEQLYTGNSGTTTRLISGILSGQKFSCSLTGDSSICKRPMGRIIKPLREMGAKIRGIDDKFCPLSYEPAVLNGMEYVMPVASAQLKSAILLAGLYADGPTTVVEPAPSRDHTERMLRALGCRIETDGRRVTVYPPEELQSVDIDVPADISSAAYFLVAGAIVPNSEITIRRVGVNPTRTGILDALRMMGAEITESNYVDGAEPVCDLTVRTSKLHG